MGAIRAVAGGARCDDRLLSLTRMRVAQFRPGAGYPNDNIYEPHVSPSVLIADSADGILVGKMGKGLWMQGRGK